jgi:hypothetical protein
VTGEQRDPAVTGGAEGKVLGVRRPRGLRGKGWLGAPAMGKVRRGSSCGGCGGRGARGSAAMGAVWEVLRWERGGVGAPAAAAARAAALGRRGTSMRRQR